MSLFTLIRIIAHVAFVPLYSVLSISLKLFTIISLFGLRPFTLILKGMVRDYENK